ncbi:hypothetical protein ABRP86_11450, partial [Corynebacterium sp. KPL3927]|uniref:hypothetical protein n=1 Tax=Corynebacterium sp. KPL3927 TaxID=3158324 RepID=UPI0032F03B52
WLDMVVDYLSSQLDWAGYQVSTTWGSGPFDLKIIRKIKDFPIFFIVSYPDTSFSLFLSQRLGHPLLLTENQILKASGKLRIFG